MDSSPEVKCDIPKNESIKNWFVIVQSTVLIIGAVIAGAWSIYEFNYNNNLRQKTETSLNISVEVKKTQKIETTNKWGLFIDLKMINTGKRNIVLNLSTVPPIRIVRVGINKKGVLINEGNVIRCNVYSGLNESGAVEIKKYQEVQVSSIKECNVYAEVDKPGLYFIAFEAREHLDVDDEEAYEKNSSWKATNLVNIGM